MLVWGCRLRWSDSCAPWLWWGRMGKQLAADSKKPQARPEVAVPAWGQDGVGSWPGSESWCSAWVQVPTSPLLLLGLGEPSSLPQASLSSSAKQVRHSPASGALVGEHTGPAGQAVTFLEDPSPGQASLPARLAPTGAAG